MTEHANETMQKFGYPDTLVAETEEWVLLARPGQVTLGSMVLICREEVSEFSACSPAAFAAMGKIICRIEPMLKNFMQYDKINYLMLMMVDPDVHFHVIPRYDGSRSFDGLDVADTGWPGPPALGDAVTPDGDVMRQLVGELRRHWLAA